MPQMPDMTAIADMMTNMMGSMSAGTMGRSVTSLAFSPDGRTLAIGGVESKSNLDIAAMMNPVLTQKKPKELQTADPDEYHEEHEGRGYRRRYTLWDVASGRRSAR